MSDQHREAFCTMFYKCDNCFAVERFWNSRDGVTPFVVLGRCRQCLGDMQHVEFHLDKRDPDHAPYRGQGIFTDMPDALKRTYAHLRFRHARGAGYEITEADEQAMYEGFQPGEPFFFRWGV